jgi:hypothetical protein
MATKIKKGVVNSIEAVCIACPACGGTCENESGSTMIDCSSEVVHCMECGAECAVPASAFKVKASKRLPREPMDEEECMEHDYIQEY